MLAVLLVASSCQEGGEQAPPCDWIEEEVLLDYSLGPWGGDETYELQPAKVLELLTAPVQGTLMWKGGGDWAHMTPDQGETRFASHVSYGGRTVYRQASGARGDLACMDTLDFDVQVHLSTDDGVLDETWQTWLSFLIAAGNVTTEIDALAEGLPGKLQIIPRSDAPMPYGNLRYWMPLYYDIYPLSPELGTTLSGRMYLRGDFEPAQDGEIVDMGGVNVLLVEWVGSSEE